MKPLLITEAHCEEPLRRCRQRRLVDVFRGRKSVTNLTDLLDRRGIEGGVGWVRASEDQRFELVRGEMRVEARMSDVLAPSRLNVEDALRYR